MSDSPSGDVSGQEVVERSFGQRALSFTWGVIWRVAVFIALVIVIRTFAVERFIIPTGSMLPTIQLDDVMLCEKVSYRFTGGPADGDIIAFDDPQGSGYVLAKRVIATEGQEVDIRDGEVYVDGVADEYGFGDTLSQSPSITYPFVVPKGKIWVMGDNREGSKDSRTFGLVDKSAVIGRFVWRLTPFDTFGAVS